MGAAASSPLNSGLELAAARPRDPLHQLTPTLSGLIPTHRASTITKSKSPPIRCLNTRPIALALASRMTEVAEYQQLDLLHVHYAIPHSISALARSANDHQPLSPLRHHAARHRHHTRRRRPLLTFPITKFSIERSDGVTTISEFMRKRTEEFFGITTAGRSHSQFRQLRTL